MSTSLTLRGGHVIDPTSGLDEVVDVHIDDGFILALGRKPRGFTPARVIEAKHLVVMPGLVDLATRLREPGAEHKASVASELWAAAANGFTTVCLPPDTDPPIDDPSVVELVNHRAEPVRGARVVCLGALTKGLGGDQLAEMGALAEIGCVGVSNAHAPMADTTLMLRAFQYARSIPMTVHYQPVEPWLAPGAGVHSSAHSMRLGLPGEPSIAEAIDTHRALLVAEEAGVHLHLGRLSSGRAAKLLRTARKRLTVTADVAIANLLYTEDEVVNYNGAFRVNPPLRTVRDRTQLRRALKDGLIDAITSDHQPHDGDAKTGAFMATEPGLSTLDGFLPALMALVADGELSLSELVRLTSTNPANILGLAGGRIAVDAPADLCLFDPNERYRFDEARLASRGRNSPHLGRDLSGSVRGTLVDGEVVFEGSGL